jgi:hypothetical protein
MSEIAFLHTPKWQMDGNHWSMLIGNRYVARLVSDPC